MTKEEIMNFLNNPPDWLYRLIWVVFAPIITFFIIRWLARYKIFSFLKIEKNLYRQNLDFNKSVCKEKLRELKWAIRTKADPGEKYNLTCEHAESYFKYLELLHRPKKWNRKFRRKKDVKWLRDNKIYIGSHYEKRYTFLLEKMEGEGKKEKELIA